MKNITHKLFIIALFFPGLTPANAQNSVSTSGGNATGTSGSASYTVGQVAYTTNSGTSGSVSQGVQQAYEITVTGSNNEVEGIELLISSYPNPVIDQLRLKIEQDDISGFKFYLFDLNGKIISTQTIGGKETVIFMGDYDPSTYFLKVFKGSKEITTFKIVKK